MSLSSEELINIRNQLLIKKIFGKNNMFLHRWLDYIIDKPKDNQTSTIEKIKSDINKALEFQTHRLDFDLKIIGYSISFRLNSDWDVPNFKVDENTSSNKTILKVDDVLGWVDLELTFTTHNVKTKIKIEHKIRTNY